MSRQFKVLVADGNPEVLLPSALLLKRTGYEVLEASTAQECLEAVQTLHPDILLLDVALPDMTGAEVCKRIKNNKNLEDIFVIFTSEMRVSSESQAEGLDIGAEGFITWPISEREFLARIRAAERIKRAEDALREREEQQQKLISRLKEALAEIKTLKGCIPICASCKKIRNDEGYWDQLEAYISKHTDAIFTHGLCPECTELYRAEIRKVSRKAY